MERHLLINVSQKNLGRFRISETEGECLDSGSQAVLVKDSGGRVFICFLIKYIHHPEKRIKSRNRQKTLDKVNEALLGNLNIMKLLLELGQKNILAGTMEKAPSELQHLATTKDFSQSEHEAKATNPQKVSISTEAGKSDEPASLQREIDELASKISSLRGLSTLEITILEEWKRRLENDELSLPVRPKLESVVVALKFQEGTINHDDDRLFDQNRGKVKDIAIYDEENKKFFVRVRGVGAFEYAFTFARTETELKIKAEDVHLNIEEGDSRVVSGARPKESDQLITDL